MAKDLGLTIDAAGHAAWSSVLGKAQRALGDFTQLWERYETDFYAMQTAAFDSEGASTGSKWKALSPAYARRKARTHPGRTILVRDGDLRDSLTRRGGSGQVRRVTPRSFVLGTADHVAKYHMSAAPRRKMPLRLSVQLTPQDVARWHDLAVAFVRDRLREAGAA